MAESYPEDLKYHPEHDWARIEAGVATFGITWFAQNQLGEVVFFDPPAVGTAVAEPTAGGSKKTTSPSWSCANHVIPNVASSPSTRAQSCSGW